MTCVQKLSRSENTFSQQVTREGFEMRSSWLKQGFWLLQCDKLFSIWWVTLWSYGNSVMWYLSMRNDFTCRIWCDCVCVFWRGGGAIMLAGGRRKEQKIMSVHANRNMCSKTHIQQKCMKLWQCVSSWFYQRYARIQTRRPVLLFVAKTIVW
jgi:hypothetical protein